MPQARHSKACSSGKQPDLGTVLASSIGFPQFGQCGMLGLGLVASMRASSHETGLKVLIWIRPGIRRMPSVSRYPPGLGLRSALAVRARAAGSQPRSADAPLNPLPKPAATGSPQHQWSKSRTFVSKRNKNACKFKQRYGRGLVRDEAAAP